MRVLFINFNLGSTPGINNGIAVLSSVLKAQGCTVGLIFLCEDIGYSFDLERIQREITMFDPDIVGISLIETQFKYALRFCEHLRTYYHGFLICGGPFPTMDPVGCFSLRGLDAVCVGEGEDALTELVEAMRNRIDYKSIQNLWFSQSDGIIIRNPLRHFKKLDTLPAEDKEIFDLDKILPLKNYQLETMLGRGCAYRCSYCINQPYIDTYRKYSDNGISIKDYVRVKNIDIAIKEIKDSIFRHPKIKKIAFIDDNFLFYNDFLENFCKEYKKEINLPFMCNANPLSYSYSKAVILKNAGCDDIRFGLESGSERVKREVLKRPIPNKSIIDAFKINNELGIMTSTFNMIGLPTETKEEVLDTLRLNAAIKPDSVKVMTFYPFKNTPIYKVCEDLNLLDLDQKLELVNYDTLTCLRFPPAHRLFLRKVQAVSNWYLNLFFSCETSEKYDILVKNIERMTEEEWARFDYEAVDKEVSGELKKNGIPHYTKFINRSLSVKYPSKHFNLL